MILFCVLNVSQYIYNCVGTGQFLAGHLAIGGAHSHTSNGINRDDGYDDDEHFDDNHDGHMDLVGLLQ